MSGENRVIEWRYLSIDRFSLKRVRSRSEIVWNYASIKRCFFFSPYLRVCVSFNSRKLARLNTEEGISSKTLEAETRTGVRRSRFQSVETLLLRAVQRNAGRPSGRTGISVLSPLPLVDCLSKRITIANRLYAKVPSPESFSTGKLNVDGNADGDVDDDSFPTALKQVSNRVLCRFSNDLQPNARSFPRKSTV